MTVYAIGNANANVDLLPVLLEKIKFDALHDSLWFAGNHIQLDAPSLSLIRFIKNLGKSAKSVLGNEDLMLLALAEGSVSDENEVKIDQISAEADFADLLKWLRQRPMMHYDNKLNFAMVHAGIPPEWTLSQARTFAIEVESALSFGNHKAFLDHIANKTVPRRWNAKLHGWKRLHFISTAFTKIQSCNEKGYMDFGIQVTPASNADQYIPWYKIANRNTANVQIVFNHKATPETQQYSNIFPIEYAKNESLTALKLDPSAETITVSL